MSYRLVDWQTLAQTVQALRARSGLNRTQLAARADLSWNTVANIEKGTARAVEADTLRALEHGLRLPAGHLYAVLGIHDRDAGDLRPIGRNLGFTDGTARAWQGRNGALNDTRGENSRGAKLTEDQVRDIKTRPRGRGGQSNAELAAEFGVSAAQIGGIRSGRYWGHVRVEGGEDGVAS